MFVCSILDRLLMVGKAAAKHAAFVRARGRHYSNEAEAMKVSFYIASDIKNVYDTLYSVLLH